MIEDATRIRVIKAILHMDSKAFATAIGVAQNTVTGWESGRSVPNQESRLAIAGLCMDRGIEFRADGMPLPKEAK